MIAARMLGNAKLFVGVLEDLPYAQNRVLHDPADPDQLRFHYDISDELRSRRSQSQRPGAGNARVTVRSPP